MTNWIDIMNFGFVAAGMAVVLLGLLMAAASRHQERWSRRFFITLFALLLVYVAADLISQISLALLGAEAALLSRAGIFFESLISSLLMPLLTLYLLHCVGEDWRKSPLFAAVGVLWLIYFALLVITQFTSVIYTVTPDNVYMRGRWYPVLLVAPAVLMLLNILALWRRREKLTRRQRSAFALYVLIPLGCMLVQMCFYGLLMIVIGSCAAAFCMYQFIVRDQFDRYSAQQAENARQKASIMVLQMRPHFIYNTMTSIYYLIRQNPEKAQQVTLDFTSYLRKNFNAVAEEGTVPFADELEHTRAYLAVEQVRFEGKLFVELDTPFTNFRLPPLTLQPIVENAVKHGVSPELSPLYVSVYTREAPGGVELSVEDTGPGFDPAAEETPHSALDNIRQRLDLLCGGTLTIAPRDAGGTQVTIFLPL